MLATIHQFLRGDSAAVTVDWVVLTALAAAFGVIVMASLVGSTVNIAQEVETALTSVTVTALPVLGVSQ